MKKVISLLSIVTVIGCGENRPSDTYLNQEVKPLEVKKADSVIEKPEKEITYAIFKRRRISGEACEWYSAVIRHINPSKDDYKAYCRYIVRDIIKHNGNDNLMILIYDDLKACHYEEAPYEEGDSYIMPNAATIRAQEKYINKHEIGSYSGYVPVEGASNYELSYYEDANNKYTETENYKVNSN